jgi:nitrite reductase/ring-hydroxylating ferredoxin subunit/uncharacterized membrane protein
MMRDAIDRVGKLEALDRFSQPVISAVGRAVQPRAVRNLLSGTDLGHPLHPMLTDVPIGAWSMASLLDVIGGRRAAPAATLLTATGIVAAVPTAASGLNDWSDTYGPTTRVGAVHALANVGALSLYSASLLARLRGRRGRARLLGLAGLGLLSIGGYLGGALSFGEGVNVNRTAWFEGPEDWTAVLDEADLAEGVSRRVDAGGVPVMLHRVGDRIHAVTAVCSHMGGPLDEGEVADGCVTCPWHGSVFRLADGGIERGPACVPQPVYETRVQDGRIELRAPER